MIRLGINIYIPDYFSITCLYLSVTEENGTEDANLEEKLSTKDQIVPGSLKVSENP